MEVKKLNQNKISDFRDLVEIFITVFENEESIANNEQLVKLLANPDFMVLCLKQIPIL